MFAVVYGISRSSTLRRDLHYFLLSMKYKNAAGKKNIRNTTNTPQCPRNVPEVNYSRLLGLRKAKAGVDFLVW